MILDGQDVAATADEILGWLCALGHDVPYGTLRRWVSEGDVAKLGKRNGRMLYSLADAQAVVEARRSLTFG